MTLSFSSPLPLVADADDADVELRPLPPRPPLRPEPPLLLLRGFLCCCCSVDMLYGACARSCLSFFLFGRREIVASQLDCCCALDCDMTWHSTNLRHFICRPNSTQLCHNQWAEIGGRAENLFNICNDEMKEWWSISKLKQTLISIVSTHKVTKADQRPHNLTQR